MIKINKKTYVEILHTIVGDCVPWNNPIYNMAYPKWHDVLGKWVPVNHILYDSSFIDNYTLKADNVYYNFENYMLTIIIDAGVNGGLLICADSGSYSFIAHTQDVIKELLDE